MSASINAKLDFWVNNNLNVLFKGKHGVGKTAMVKDVFDRHKLNWRYFSASTMDPWCDFIGVPRERTENKMPPEYLLLRSIASLGKCVAVKWAMANWKIDEAASTQIVDHALAAKEGITYLDLVRPHQFATGEVEALFFDEFNRSPKKVRNAVLELIQFKSINGMSFPNLRFVWAAINPDDDDVNDYDVEKLDPAQQDRFHVQIHVPYTPNAEWFRSRYGNRLADSAIGWWEELSEEEKDNVSPRRLQYALDVYRAKGDMRDVLPVSSNVSKLTSALNNGPVTERLETMLNTRNIDEAKKFLENENNYNSASKYIFASDRLLSFFGPVMPKEKISSQMEADDKFCSHVISNLGKHPVFHGICHDIMDANQNAKLCKKIRRALTESPELQAAYRSKPGHIETQQALPLHFTKSRSDYSKELSKIDRAQVVTVPQRIAIYEKIDKHMPEVMDERQATETLAALNCVFSNIESIKDESERQKWQFSTIVNNKPFGNLMGIINNCIMNISRSRGISARQALSESQTHFMGLLEKILVSGLSSSLMQGE